MARHHLKRSPYTPDSAGKSDGEARPSKTPRLEPDDENKDVKPSLPSPKSPAKGKSSTKTASTATSPKAVVAEAVINQGLAAMTKEVLDELAKSTGKDKQWLRNQLKDGRHNVRRALLEVVASLEKEG